MAKTPLVAHSLAEAYLYLMVTPCGSCVQGSLDGEPARVVSTEGGRAVVEIEVECTSCRARQSLCFSVPPHTVASGRDAVAPVNESDEPSQIIDVAQWLTLFRAIAEMASREANKVRARELGIEAAQCLEEALRFYEDDNDLPPPEALFHDRSRARLAQSPEQFAKDRLIDLRSKLPSLSAMHACLTRKPSKRWWQFWRK